MTIEIYRYGNYINCVGSKDALREWLIANVPFHTEVGSIPPTATLNRCIKIAMGKGYEIKVDESFGKIEKILDVAKIEEVAKQFFKLTKKGENYVFDCPFCEGKKTGMISPKYQIYKCFSCGKTGSVMNLVMEFNDMSYAEAEKYLAEFYNIN